MHLGLKWFFITYCVSPQLINRLVFVVLNSASFDYELGVSLVFLSLDLCKQYIFLYSEYRISMALCIVPWL